MSKHKRSQRRHKEGKSVGAWLGEHDGLNLTSNNRTFCDILCTVSAHAAERNTSHRSSTRFRFQFVVVSPPEQVTDPRSFDQQSSSIDISISPSIPLWYFFPTFPRDYPRRHFVYSLRIVHDIYNRRKNHFFISKIGKYGSIFKILIVDLTRALLYNKN